MHSPLFDSSAGSVFTGCSPSPAGPSAAELVATTGETAFEVAAAAACRASSRRLASAWATSHLRLSS